MWNVVPESKIQLVNCGLSPIFPLGHSSLPDIRTMYAYIFSVPRANLFIGIVYRVNLFTGIVISRIIDCWLDSTSYELFYCFCQNPWSILSLIWHVYIFLLYIHSDRRLKWSIHCNIIDVTFDLFVFLFHDSQNSFLKIFTGQLFAVTLILFV